MKMRYGTLYDTNDQANLIIPIVAFIDEWGYWVSVHSRDWKTDYSPLMNRTYGAASLYLAPPPQEKN